MYSSRTDVPNIIILRKDNSNTTVGLTIHEKIVICGHEGYQTSVKDVMVVILNPKDMYINASNALTDINNVIVLECLFQLL